MALNIDESSYSTEKAIEYAELIQFVGNDTGPRGSRPSRLLALDPDHAGLPTAGALAAVGEEQLGRGVGA